MQKLFHKDVFLPEGINEVCKKLQTNLTSYFYSRHFKEHLDNQLVENRSHLYLKDVVTKCLDSIKTTPREVFEVELSKLEDCWKVTKYCCRIPYDSTQDLVVAIRPQYNYNGVVVNNMIVTAWMNHKYDHHTTLDTTKYCSEYEWKYKT